MNYVTLIGNIGSAIETRLSNSGKHIASFSLAVNRKNGDGESITFWMRCVAFGELAEQLDGTEKGTRLIVQGRLAESNWTDKEGVERRTTELLLDDAGRSLRFRPRGEGGGFNADPF